MVPLVCEGFALDLMTWFCTLDTRYKVGENYVAGQQPLDMRDPNGLLLSSVALTQYEEPSSTTKSGRRDHQERIVRFVVKDLNPQAAVERGWQLYQAIWNGGQFDSLRFHAMVARGVKTPTVFVRGDDGSALADFIFQFLVYSR